MNPNFTAYNDAASRAMVLRFRAALGPLMEQVAPDRLLHHIELHREREDFGHGERVEIRLVIKPIGQANIVDPDGDLKTGPKRLNDQAKRRPAP
jgi:hypothetical protein